MKYNTLKTLLGYSLIASLAVAPVAAIAKSPNANANANANAQSGSCLRAFGHLVAPGWIKKNGTTTVEDYCTLPFGISVKLGGERPPHPGTTTPPGTPDTTPNAFTFVDQTGVALNTVVQSNIVTVAGINTAAAVSVSGGEYSVNGGAYTAVSSTVNAGDTVRVRHTSSASFSTAVHTTLTIGGVSDTFTSTTLAAGDTTAPSIFVVLTTTGTSTATVTWFTNEGASSQLAYGTTTAYGSLSALDSSLTFFHSVTVTGLDASTTYHFQVMSRDASGNLGTSTDAIFATDPLPDTTAPVISAIVGAGVSSTTAVVTWTTDEPATSKVYYGAGTSLDLGTANTVSSSTLVTSHSLGIAGLTASTTYTFAVESMDASVNTSVSATSTFVTGL